MPRPSNPRKAEKLLQLPGVQSDNPELMKQVLPMYLQPKGVDRYNESTRVGPEHAVKVRNFMFDDGQLVSRRGTEIMGGEASSTPLQMVEFIRKGQEKVTIRFCLRHLEIFEYGLRAWRAFALPLTGSDRDLFAFTGWADKLLFSNGVDGLWEFDFKTMEAKLVPGGPSCKHLTTFGNRVIASHTQEKGPDFPLRVRWSAKNDYTKWDEINHQGAGLEDLYGSPGGGTDEVMGVYPYSDEAAWMVRSRSCVIMSVSGNVLAPFRFSHVLIGVGSPFRYSVAQVADGVMFASRDNIHHLSANGHELIGELIFDEIAEEAETLRGSYAAYDVGRREYRLAKDNLVWRYRFTEKGWTADEYPFAIRSLARQIQGVAGIPIDNLPGIIDDLEGAINDLVYFRDLDDSMMFVDQAAPVTFVETDGIQDALSTGENTNSELLLETGVVNISPLHAVELHGIHGEYDSKAAQQLIFEITEDDGATWAPLSVKDIEPTDGSEMFHVKQERVSRKLRIRLRSITLGAFKLLGLGPEVVKVERTMAPKKPKVASIEISPSFISLSVGGTQTLVITMRDAAGRVVSGKRPTLVSTHNSIATVSSSGLVRGMTAGNFGIVASLGNVQATASGNVAAAAPVAVATVTVVPASSEGAAGSEQQFTATIRDSNGNVLLGRTVVWASSDLTKATVTQAGVVTLVAAGSAVISAISEGITGAATVTVTASADVVASVELTPSSFAGEVGDTFQLAAVAKNSGGTILSGKLIVWETSNVAVATVNAAGLVTMTGAGSVTITAECEGFDDTSTGTVTAVPAAAFTVTVTPASFTKTIGQTQQLTVVVRDVDGNILVGRTITYTSSNNGVASVNATGLVTAIAVGNTTLTATCEGRSGFASMVVSQVPVATVTVAPSSFSIQSGQTQQLTATPKDSNGVTLIGRTVTWGSSNNAVATVSSTGLVQGVTVGSATITATCEGIAGTSAATISGVVAGVIQAQMKRHKGSTGPGSCRIMIPVAPGVIPSTAALNSVIIEINGTERAVRLEALGRHPDGSYMIIGGDVFVESIAVGTTVSARVILAGSPTVARTTPPVSYAYARNSADPRLSGYPDITLTPSSADYLVTTQLTGPWELRTRAQIVALGGQYQRFWHRLEDFAEWWWSTNAGSGPNGTAPSAANAAAWQACNTNNANFPSFGNLTSSADDFQAWRVAAGYVGNSTYPGNAYDWGNVLLSAWLQTADTKYLIKGLSFISVYVWEYLKRGGIDLQISGVNGFNAFPHGCVSYYLLTGDTMGKLVVEFMADRFFRVLYPGYFHVDNGIGSSALLSAPNGTMIGFDPRECARILAVAIAGHRARSTTSHFSGDNSHNPCDYAAKATEVVTLLKRTGAEKFALKADGTWREQRCTDAAGMYINTFTQSMLGNELINYYHQITADADIIGLVSDLWDTLYSTLFDIWDYTFDGVTWFTAERKSFRNNFDGQCASLDVPHADAGDSSGFTTMYVSLAAWVYARTANNTYRTQAIDAFNEGVGVDVVAGDAGAFGEPFQYSRKILGEHFHNTPQFFEFLA